ncbi:Coenzyme F420 hydrogenase/dehydrogenase, beta subunit C-terminal domain [Anaerobutyricum hallii]|uniref:Coenzyme F420 hydrogenase/dehydrogenase, beta subunit C-terminal domain n=1 Tax=Anaerobutyricum hallii TaxID=39488 RepID=UPI0024931915|nr:Coenzyme F420 hydrogenase/dehydrogenase, beta subunit C-terminal domain [Anaerobutyricum hallii]
MLLIEDKKNCCGCTACYTICPKSAIQMKEDQEGFLYPRISTDQCINCGLCEKICPIINRSIESDNNETMQIGIQNKDLKQRMESTAGGAFSLIAEYVIDNHGYVYGAGWENALVVHKEVCNQEGIKELRGSKYVQSSLKETFGNIEKKLKAGALVLFVGTPCQVNALHRITGDNEKLILIDLLCLGVSSPGILNSWIQYLKKKYKSNVCNVEFRNKRFGYATTNVRINFENGQKLEQKYDSKSYSQTFFKGYNVRPSCYECKFRMIPRVSDFTIGDFVDIGMYSKSLDDDKGTTLMYVHTDKARKILSEITNKFDVIEIGNKRSSVVGGKEKQIQIPKNRDQFFADYSSLEWNNFIHKYVPNTWKSKMANVGRIVIGYMPFRHKLFKLIRKKKSASFRKNVENVNRDT